MKLKIRIADISKYVDAGFNVEVHVILPGNVVAEEPKKSEHKRTFVTTDRSVYKFVAKSPKELREGSDQSRAYEQLMNMFRGSTSMRRTRSQLTSFLTQHLAWGKTKAVNVLANLRRKGFVELETI